ncbi:MAG: xanthine dehydrogenase small subunit [Bacteroidales bacterium]|nr:xanthine dehydrogenase small subunit [Bacteroidales bacterium]
MNYQPNISFILDDKIVTIDFSKEKNLKPTTNVLEYLRLFRTKKGIKEGCGQGDCGACTIVLGELDKENGISYKSVNSCLLLLPMMHGKQLITVENLAAKVNNNLILHPVQQAVIDTNSSQCGYCTPGMVMSLFALFKNYKNPSREIIEDALSGNLCRCTGYQPLIKAAQNSCKGQKDSFEENKSQTINLLKEINQKTKTISIYAEDVQYFRSTNLSETLQIRKENPDAILLSGGTDSSYKNISEKLKPLKIIDVSGVEDIQYFTEDENNFYIGSGLNLEKFRSLTTFKIPIFDDILKVFGSLQIKNLATIGGNIGGASPIGDLIPVLFALKAKIKLQSSSKIRIIKIENFIKSYRKTDIKTDEIIESVIIPKSDKNIIKSYKISKRKNLDISTLSGAFNILLDERLFVKEIILAFGGMAEITKRAHKTEDFLLKKRWERNTINKAVEILKNEFKPISDARSDKEFRRIAAGNLLIKFWSETNE